MHLLLSSFSSLQQIVFQCTFSPWNSLSAQAVWCSFWRLGISIWDSSHWYRLQSRYVTLSVSGEPLDYRSATKRYSIDIFDDDLIFNSFLRDPYIPFFHVSILLSSLSTVFLRRIKGFIWTSGCQHGIHHRFKSAYDKQPICTIKEKLLLRYSLKIYLAR